MNINQIYLFFQSVAFLHCVMTCEHLDIKSSLILCPLNTVMNWAKEINMWQTDARSKLKVFKFYDCKDVESKVRLLQSWKRQGGVGIMHYDMYRLLLDDGIPTTRKARNKKIKKSKTSIQLDKHRGTIKECLLENPDLVIADEGHLLK